MMTSIWKHPSNLQIMTVEGKRLLVCLKKKKAHGISGEPRNRGRLQPLLNCDLMICICAFLSSWICPWLNNKNSPGHAQTEQWITFFYSCASLVTKSMDTKKKHIRGTQKMYLLGRKSLKNYLQHFSMIQHDGRFDEGGPWICQFDIYCIFQQ